MTSLIAAPETPILPEKARYFRASMNQRQSALQNLDRRSERIDRCKAAGMAENVAAEVGSG